MKTINDRLKETREICEKATPAPWNTNKPACYNTYPGMYLVFRNEGVNEGDIVVNDDEAERTNLEFIAHARNTMPLLVEALAKATAALERYTVDKEWIEREATEDKPGLLHHYIHMQNIARKALTEIETILGGGE